jgi:DNA-binding YbaB/EbfC family protein
MFKELGQMMNMLKNLPKMKEETEKLQQRLSQITAEGNAGAGMVTAKVNGSLQLIACAISEDALKLGDREVLEDLVMAAVNQALQKARELVAEETGKMAMGMGLPGFPQA